MGLNSYVSEAFFISLQVVVNGQMPICQSFHSKMAPKASWVGSKWGPHLRSSFFPWIPTLKVLYFLTHLTNLHQIFTEGGLRTCFIRIWHFFADPAFTACAAGAQTSRVRKNSYVFQLKRRIAHWVDLISRPNLDRGMLQNHLYQNLTLFCRSRNRSLRSRRARALRRKKLQCFSIIMWNCS